MRIGPLIFEKKKPADIRCFHLEGLSAKDDEDPEFAVSLKKALRDDGVIHLGVSTPENLWCVEDPTRDGRALKVFSRFGLQAREISPEAGRKFGRWTVGVQPRREGGRQ